MKNQLIRALLCGLAGILIGMSTGVAAFGSAVNGAVVFGPIAALIGWIFPWRKMDRSNVLSEDLTELNKEKTETKSNFQHIEKAINEGAPILSKILISIWNIQMNILKTIGLMPFIKKYPWLLLLLCFGLLLFLLPIGVIFFVSGFVAVNYGMSPEDNFIIDLDKTSV